MSPRLNPEIRRRLDRIINLRSLSVMPMKPTRPSSGISKTARLFQRPRLLYVRPLPEIASKHQVHLSQVSPRMAKKEILVWTRVVMNRRDLLRLAATGIAPAFGA